MPKAECECGCWYIRKWKECEEEDYRVIVFLCKHRNDNVASGNKSSRLENTSSTCLDDENSYALLEMVEIVESFLTCRT